LMLQWRFPKAAIRGGRYVGRWLNSHSADNGDV
jgi:hypothetical protein